MVSRLLLTISLAVCAASAAAQPPSRMAPAPVVQPTPVLFIEARDMHDARGGSASGVVVTVADNDGRLREEWYVDADELRGLIKLRGLFDAALQKRRSGAPR